jgi:hypothetical protein
LFRLSKAVRRLFGGAFLTALAVTLPLALGTVGPSAAAVPGGASTASPSIEPYRYVSEFGSFGSGDGQFVDPRVVGVDTAGEVFTWDASDGRIQVFDATGKLLRKWTLAGGATDVAASRSGHVYAYDYRTVLSAYDTAGSFLWQRTVDNDQHPVALGDGVIGVDFAGNVHVAFRWVNEASSHIETYSPTGANNSGYPLNGGTGETTPRDVAEDGADREGHLYIAWGNAIDLMQYGSFVSRWATPGSAGAIAVDGAGHVLQTDRSAHNVQAFTTGGLFLGTFGGSGAGTLGDPTGIAAAPSGDVYVSDSPNHRIVRFALGASVRITKQLLPASDSGRFDLAIEQTVVVPGAGDGDSSVVGIAPGTYRISESGADGTILSQYTPSIACTMNGGPGPSGIGTTQLNVTVVAGDQLDCTLTNRRKPTITVAKSLVPTSDPGRFDLKAAGTVVKSSAGNGDSGSIDVAAGTYRVTEVAAVGPSLSNYSTSIACTLNGGPGPSAAETTKLDVTAADGDRLACTLTNRRKATLTLTKHLTPVSDPGRFNLKVGGTVVKAGAGEGGSGSMQLAPGSYSVSEVAAAGTNLSDYASSIACTLNGGAGLSGNGPVLNVTVSAGDELGCTLTNKRKAAVTLTKLLLPASDSGRFDLRLGSTVIKAGAGNGDSGSIQVAPGTYRVTEIGVAGTSLANFSTSIACTLNGVSGPAARGTTKLDVTVMAEDVLACTLTNRRKATITLTKHLMPSSDSGAFDLKVGGTVVRAGAGDGNSGSRQVGAGTYTLSEVAAAGTSLSNYGSSILCTLNGVSGAPGSGTSLKVTVAAGDVLVCTITNQRT